MSGTVNTTRVFVSGNLRRGGAEVLRVELLEQLAGQKVILVLLGSENLFEERLQAIGGLRVITLGGKVSFKHPSTTLRLARLFRQLRPDVVQSGQFDTNFHTRVAAAIARVPVCIVEEHGLNEWKSRAHWRIDWALAKCTAGQLAVSAAVADFASVRAGIAREDFTVLHNPVTSAVLKSAPSDSNAAKAALGIESDCWIIGHVGTLRREKGHDVLFRALANLKLEKRLPENWLCLLVGGGPLRVGLESLAASLGISHNIRWEGDQTNVTPFLDAMDVFAFPSRNEALGIALLEAMARGRPVVASDVGGIPEIVNHGDTGLLFRASDDKLMAAEIYRLIADRALAVQLGVNARVYVSSKHGPATYAQAILTMQNSCLLAHGRQPASGV